MLQDQGIRVMLTSYPSLLSAQNCAESPEIFLGIRKFCIGLSAAGLLDGYERFNATSAVVAAEQKTMFADCARQLPKTSEYFGDGVHYTDLGARRVAELVASTLLSSYKDHPTIQVSGGGDNMGGSP